MSTDGIGIELSQALVTAAGCPRLLLASDYDGCIAPIVSRPQDAVGDGRSVTALVDASRMPRTHAAVVSGRALADLAALSGLDPDGGVTLVGSHGSEFTGGFSRPVTDVQKRLLAWIVESLTDVADRYPGVTVETKPVSAALHVRNVGPDDAAAALAAVRSGPATADGVHVTEGKAVIELAVIEVSKGDALDRLRTDTHADTVIYLGDDVTDERAFAHLSGTDIGIKVGDGDTIAGHRIGDTDDVAAVLRLIADERRNRLTESAAAQ